MKAFTKENFEKFIASEPNDDTDDYRSTSQDRAAVVFDRFLKWLEVVNAPKIIFPVRQRNSISTVIEDARGKKVATAPNPRAAATLVQQLNAGHRPDSNDTDARPANKRSEDDPDEGRNEDVALKPNPKVRTTAGRKNTTTKFN